MITNVKIITASSFLAMFFLGVASAIIGAAARNIGLSPVQIGLLIAVQNLGFMVAVAASGFLADSRDKPKILLWGSLILAISFFTFYLTRNFLINSLIMFFIGAGIGTYEGVTDAMLLGIHREKESLYVNVNHFFVNFGSLMITLYLVFLQMNWRASIVQSGFVVLLLAGSFALMKVKGQAGARGASYTARLKIMAGDPFIRTLFLVALLAVGVEISTVGVLTTYLMELRGFSQVTSKLGLIVFLLGMATGRLVIGFFTANRQIPRYLVVMFGLSFLLFAALFSVNLAEFTYVLMFLAGIAMSAILPLIITLAGLLYPEMAGTILGTLKVAFPVGGMLIPFLISVVSEYRSFAAAVWVLPLSFLAAFGLFLFQLNSLEAVEFKSHLTSRT